MATSDEIPSTLLRALYDTLASLSNNPYPHVPNPETCKKRASVALVLRVRPTFHHWPKQPDTPPSLQQFFEQDWVQHGDPEAVFIKRAAREGDRWTSHVALPGGKRDPEDEDDKAVAIRETMEEIGLNLNSPHALYVGNLPERVVSTSWGKVPIMVLCPFVFLWTQPELPPLKLQPTEVASTHWVPLRVLLSPQARTYEYVDVSDRFARQGGAIIKTAVRSILGKMRFSAIQLTPSESLYCSSTDEFFTEEIPNTSRSKNFYNKSLGNHAALANPGSLLLWGLTLGMLADFLHQLPPYNAIELWSYPTFTSLDVQFVINILTRSLKRRNEGKLRGAQVNQTAMDSETQAVATGDNPSLVGRFSDGTEGSGEGKNATRTYAVGVMLEGYYDMARKGVWIAASARVMAVASLAVYLIRTFRQRK